MKSKATAFFAAAVKAALALLYAPMKCLPTADKVVFLSRQSNQPGLDFRLLQQSLLRSQPNLKTVTITQRLDKNLGSALRFGWATLCSLYHLATAKVCVLDSYWPAVSILKHKKELTVIQMWHAIGKLKQSGYQTLDKGYGRSSAMAQVMGMHRGYDVVIAGGKTMNPFYCASFGVEEEQLFNIGLPRIDYLLEQEQANRALAWEQYPRLRGKTVVLYAPTFRRGSLADYREITAAFDPDRFALIVKPHPNQALADPESLEAYACPGLTTMQALDACDIVITDYSAISLEAAVLGRPIYFYLFDHQGYLSKNGVNIDPYREMPANVYEDPAALWAAIGAGRYDRAALDAFRSRYLPEKLGGSTAALTNLILDCVKDGKHEGICKNLHREAEAGVSLVH